MQQQAAFRCGLRHRSHDGHADDRLHRWEILRSRPGMIKASSLAWSCLSAALNFLASFKRLTYINKLQIWAPFFCCIAAYVVKLLSGNVEELKQSSR